MVQVFGICAKHTHVSRATAFRLWAGWLLWVETASPGDWEAVDGAVLVVLRSPSAALPRTAVTQTSAGYRTHRPLHGNQREPVWQHPPAPIAAKPKLEI